MSDISNVPMYIPILASLAILVVPGIVIESYWWWMDRRRNRGEELYGGAEENPVRGPVSRKDEESRAA